mgnify:CR=1 FL=1|tara:strand:- start:21550 stop:22653 length:1104 start_codon:yes stop_codon:yes gene_type:complete
MIDAKKFWNMLEKNNFGPWVGVPCSVFKPLLKVAESASRHSYFMATSEGEAMGIAAGLQMGGKIPIVFMSNSGLGNTVNPLTSLHMVYEIPVLMLISWRGEPGKKDEPQHHLMGSITRELLELMGIYTETLTSVEKEVSRQLTNMKRRIEHTKKPVALIFPRGSLKPVTAQKNMSRLLFPLNRKQAINIVCEAVDKHALIISSTGKISRELYEIHPNRKNNFAMTGSMGCALPIGFGLSLAKRNKKIVVLDGDGAALMKMGNYATVGHYKPSNLVHIVLDNESHESTGGQQTVSNTVKLDKIAMVSGYMTSSKVKTAIGLKRALKKIYRRKGPHAILVKVASKSNKDLIRVGLIPAEIKKRFCKAII